MLTRALCFPPHLEMRAHFLLQLKGNPNFPSHHKRQPVSPVESRVEPSGSRFKEKGHRVPPQLEISPDSPPPLQCNPKYPLTTGWGPVSVLVL